MSKDVSIPTFTIQYLMESGQGLTSNLSYLVECIFCILHVDNYFITMYNTSYIPHFMQIPNIQG